MGAFTRVIITVVLGSAVVVYTFDQNNESRIYAKVTLSSGGVLAHVLRSRLAVNLGLD